MPLIDLDHRIEYAWIGPRADGGDTIVLLHHGLGSVSAWRDFPTSVAAATGRPVLVYSRYGNGASQAAPHEARPNDFMRTEASFLGELLVALEVRRPILVGHSDGASIAILYAGEVNVPAARGLVLMAPHVFVEPCTVESAGTARDDFRSGDLRERLARHHDDPESAFHAWYGSWSRPEFADWNIEDAVSRIRVPMTVIQGLDDEYGTVEQVDRIGARAAAHVDAILLPSCGHAPWRDEPEIVVEAIAHRVRV